MFCPYGSLRKTLPTVPWHCSPMCHHFCPIFFVLPPEVGKPSDARVMLNREASQSDCKLPREKGLQVNYAPPFPIFSINHRSSFKYPPKVMIFFISSRSNFRSRIYKPHLPPCWNHGFSPIDVLMATKPHLRNPPVHGAAGQLHTRGLRPCGQGWMGLKAHVWL